MSEAMIERVARRLFWMNGQYAERGMKTWCDAPALVREKFMKEAREAIDEMREPTEAMEKAGIDHCGGDGSVLGGYEAMIDAALGEQP